MIFEMDRRTSRKAVAVHEAGHLFVGLHGPQLGFIHNPPIVVWIERRNAGWEGMVEYPAMPMIPNGQWPSFSFN